MALKHFGNKKKEYKVIPHLEKAEEKHAFENNKKVSVLIIVFVLDFLLMAQI